MGRARLKGQRSIERERRRQQANAEFAAMSEEQRAETIAVLGEFDRLTESLPRHLKETLMYFILDDVVDDDGNLYRCNAELENLREPLKKVMSFRRDG